MTWNICILSQILDEGELQVSEKERKSEQENKFKDVATIIAEKCINSETKKPFSVGLIENSLRDLHISINPNKSSKQQALEIIKELEKSLPILRASMRIRIYIPLKSAKPVKAKVLGLIQTVEDEDHGSFYQMTCLIEPGAFRKIDELLGAECKGAARVEVLDVCVKDFDKEEEKDEEDED